MGTANNSNRVIAFGYNSVNSWKSILTAFSVKILLCLPSFAFMSQSTTNSFLPWNAFRGIIHASYIMLLLIPLGRCHELFVNCLFLSENYSSPDNATNPGIKKRGYVHPKQQQTQKSRDIGHIQPSNKWEWQLQQYSFLFREATFTAFSLFFQVRVSYA